MQLPLAHVGGLGVVTRALLTGTPMTFDPADATATLTAAVPTQLERDDHRRFRAVLVGGSADWRRDRGANVVRTYGLTESYGGVVYDGVPLPRRRGARRRGRGAAAVRVAAAAATTTAPSRSMTAGCRPATKASGTAPASSSTVAEAT